MPPTSVSHAAAGQQQRPQRGEVGRLASSSPSRSRIADVGGVPVGGDERRAAGSCSTTSPALTSGRPCEPAEHGGHRFFSAGIVHCGGRAGVEHQHVGALRAELLGDLRVARWPDCPGRRSRRR